MNFRAKMWSDVQKTWLQEYEWLISVEYPNEILKFIALYECLLAYSKASFWDSKDRGNKSPDHDHSWFKKGFKRLIEAQPISPDLNTHISDLCRALITHSPQPLKVKNPNYYDEIKAQVKEKYPASLIDFPEHIHNSLNNPPPLEHTDGIKVYLEHLGDLFAFSQDFSPKKQDNICKKRYFKCYFSLLIHSRNWVYHNNKSGHVEPDKLVLSNHIKIMEFMIENWK